MKKLFLLLFVLLAVACTTDIPTTPPQTWGEYSFRLEARPPVIVKGMNEFLLIGNYGERKRAIDLIVSFRIGAAGKWHQAIQDGNTGVYRRAMNVHDPKTDVLYVHVKKKGEEKVFKFPLNYATSSSLSDTSGT
ncbi:MAG: hypothetical protein R3240_01035 [Gammaproteobacteria bacterium]|nr:hypothetical protein [Gammaproteobacteria bacterium]